MVGQVESGGLGESKQIKTCSSCFYYHVPNSGSCENVLFMVFPSKSLHCQGDKPYRYKIIKRTPLTQLREIVVLTSNSHFGREDLRPGTVTVHKLCSGM